jgi:hypothetical protein
VVARVVAVNDVVWAAGVVEVGRVLCWVVPTWRRAAARNTHASGDSVQPFWVEPSSDDRTGVTRSSTRASIDGVAVVEDTCCWGDTVDIVAIVAGVDIEDTVFEAAATVAADGVTETEPAVSAR